LVVYQEGNRVEQLAVVGPGLVDLVSLPAMTVLNYVRSMKDVRLKLKNLL
jgi:hypothetical protein